MKISRSTFCFALFLLLSCCKPLTDCNKLISDLREKIDSGYFDKAILLADTIKANCGDDKNLIMETDSLLQISERIKLDFSLSEEQFLAKITSYKVPVSDAILAEWEKKGWLEWRIINGEKMYFNRAASNLLLLKTFYEDKENLNSENASDSGMIQRLNHTEQVIMESGNKNNPVVPIKMVITYTITVNPDAVPAGEKIKCWMPWPKENHIRQQQVEFLDASDNSYVISPDSAIHRSIYMEGLSEKGIPAVFSASFSYQSAALYFNLSELKILPYNKNSELYKKYTSEQLPQVCFTDNIRHLADEITSPDDDPVTIVRKIYLWIKDNIPWTGAVEYSTIKNIPEYVYLHRRGDCGMQTFFFMSMLRYKGIPVRWQSGWKVPPGYKNLHDWCEIYFEGPGWVPADISYDLQQSEYTALKEFFISGIDSYRLIVNDGVAGSLYPPKQYMRSEPFDFQRGEVEWRGGNLYFDKWDYEMKIEYIN